MINYIKNGKPKEPCWLDLSAAWIRRDPTLSGWAELTHHKIVGESSPLSFVPITVVPWSVSCLHWGLYILAPTSWATKSESESVSGVGVVGVGVSFRSCRSQFPELVSDLVFETNSDFGTSNQRGVYALCNVTIHTHVCICTHVHTHTDKRK